MPIRGSSYDILGVSVGRVGAVQDLVHIELDNGLTALYGANGAGKSQILNLVEHALRGTNPATLTEVGRTVLDVHLQFHDDLRYSDRKTRLAGSGANVDFLVGALEETARRHAAEVRERNLPVPAESGPLLERLLGMRRAVLDIERRERARQAEGAPDEALIELETVAWDALLSTAASERRLTLRAVGRPEEPRWRIMLACSSSSLLRAEEAARTTWERLEDSGLVRPYALGNPVDGVYWHGELPERGFRLPKALQIPVPAHGHLGEVRASRVIAEVRRGLPRKTTYTAREWIPGFDVAAVYSDMSEEVDVDQATLTFLLDTRETIHEGVLGDDGQFDETFLDDVHDLEEGANAMVRHLIAGSTELRFDVMEPESWLRGRLPRWRANGWDLPHLSHAERRLTSLAVRLARTDGPFVLLCDEPEQGLHRLAEHRLATALPRMMQERGGTAVVATHSPDLLNAPNVNSIFVTRDENEQVHTRVAKPSLVDGQTARDSAREFGLAPGDLYGLSRLSVVVEGIHDEWVFKSVLRDELDSASAAIFPMHGATRLRSLTEAKLLMDGTAAMILIVLDDLDHDVALLALESLKRAVRDGDQNEINRALGSMRELGKANDSFLFIHQLALEAVELRELDRIHLFGLSLPDVICYLEPSSVLLEDRPWEELIKEWTDEAAPRPPKNIKGWLRKKRLLHDSPPAINEAIELAAIQAVQVGAPVHPDLVALGTTITAMGLTS